MDKPDEVMRFSDLHFQFHLEMVRASDNAILLTTFSRLNLNTTACFLPEVIQPRENTDTGRTPENSRPPGEKAQCV
jgi:DNA-binding GntR family transcriptional regulator